MRNLFIVNTPFHLLTAYIISRFMKKGDKNYLGVTKAAISLIYVIK